MVFKKQLSETEFFCWNFIQDNLSKISHMTISKVAEEAHVSISTVNRTLNKMGYDGYSDFKHTVKSSKNYPINGFSNEVNEAFLKNETEITRTINQLSVEEIENAIRLINRHENITLIAMGLSTTVSQEMMAKLQLFGKRVTRYDDPEFMKYHAGKMNKTDLVIVISISGETPELVDTISIAKAKGTEILALTANPLSSIARAADINISAYKSKVKELNFGLDVASRIPLQIVNRILIDAFAIYKQNATIRNI
ncbi:MurR/RpiR family transcriptional regulator [Lactovum miscens]|uniref:DNA-binding MurR/RpiR family transcriptional regulator n=1 Tax=Lactovum miscens TaxID=190387 RepID=A0A841C7U1_9LACT|nr:MurR/RpiR family transcriptional regulator [Lactovum miscens]MBB5888555.1 DNA-binding MurR/RpiR family transcriptional regulator [Lactovum miscens]